MAPSVAILLIGYLFYRKCGKCEKCRWLLRWLPCSLVLCFVEYVEHVKNIGGSHAHWLNFKMVYTESELNQLKKNELVKIILHNQEVMRRLDDLTDKISKLEAKFDESNSVTLVAQNTSDLLTKKVRTLEEDLLKAEQYSRRECLDVVGISKTVANDEVEEEVCKILKDIDITLEAENDIQACHRYGKKDVVIVKFSNRKLVNKVLS